MKNSIVFLAAVLILGAGVPLAWADALPLGRPMGQMSAAAVSIPTPVSTPRPHHHHKRKDRESREFAAPQSVFYGLQPAPTPSPIATPIPVHTGEGAVFHGSFPKPQ